MNVFPLTFLHFSSFSRFYFDFQKLYKQLLSILEQQSLKSSKMHVTRVCVLMMSPCPFFFIFFFLVSPCSSKGLFSYFNV